MDKSNIGKRNDYICGIVEGFYGRPWTLDQRKHLFGRLSDLGLNTYLYAPKDDIKHRSAWRELYTDEEISILRDLIEYAKSNNINFVYALSPGLDIMYSSKDELFSLKTKLQQVSNAGCDSFALLFDDIEVRMQENDKKQFNSFADAQVYITNAVFDQIVSKNFYFCPTEYCETRSIPTLENSEYLRTIGKNLRLPIHVMWTGPRVISREITVDHLQTVVNVLRRKPLIWDNLHANDYDQKRVFMGPFKGRSVEIKKLTSGLLLNPNCKYETNYVPLNTLGDWNTAQEDGVINDKNLEDKSYNQPNFYNCDESLKKAVLSWIHNFNAPNGPNIPQIPKIVANNDGAVFVLDRQKSENNSTTGETTIQLEEIIQTVVAPEIVEKNEELNSLTVDYAQPMEEDESVQSFNEPTEDEMEIIEESQSPEVHRDPEFCQISALVEMFYLPFECGSRIRTLFESYSWILENASVMNKKHEEIGKLTTLQSEWLARYDIINETLSNLLEAFSYIADSSNRALVSELIPYAWEAHGSSAVLLAVAKWIMQGILNDFSGKVEPFWEYLSYDEPWVTQGGFVNDCIKVLATNETIAKLFLTKAVLPVSIVTYEIRPYSLEDEEYICQLSTYLSLTNDKKLLKIKSGVFSDRHVKPFLLAGAKHNFICEELNMVSNTKKPMCFASAHTNGILLQEFLIDYKEQLKVKYSKDSRDDTIGITNKLDNWFPKVPADIFSYYPAWIDTHFNMDSYDAVPMKRIIQSIAVVLSLNGISGMFVTVPIEQQDRSQYFSRLGFHNIGITECEKFSIYGHELTASNKEPPKFNLE